MKFERTPQRTSVAIYAFLVIAASTVFAAAWNHLDEVLLWIRRIFGYVSPVTYGLILAFVFSPLLRFFDDRLLPWLFRRKLGRGLRRGLAILLTYLTVALTLTAILLLILPRLLASIQDVILQIYAFLRTVPNLYERLSDWIGSFSSDSALSQIMTELLSQGAAALQSELANLGTWLAALVTGTVDGLASMLSGLANWLVGAVISIYILFSRERLLAQCKKLLRALFPPKAGDELARISQDAYRIFSGYVASSILDALCVGVLCFIGMRIFGWPFAMLISVIVACANMIPFFGPFIGAVPALLLLLAQDPLYALGFLIFILVLQQIDGNILRPRIVGSSIGLAPLWVMFGLLLFGGLMGLLGMFIGSPLFAVLYNALRRIVNALLRRKREPTGLCAYESSKNPIERQP